MPIAMATAALGEIRSAGPSMRRSLKSLEGRFIKAVRQDFRILQDLQDRSFIGEFEVFEHIL
jgi:hypothetical protein